MFEQLAEFKKATGLDFEDYVEDDTIILNNLIEPSKMQIALVEANILGFKVLSDIFTVFISYYNHTFIRTIDILTPNGHEKFIFEYRNGIALLKQISLLTIEGRTKYFYTSEFVCTDTNSSYSKELDKKLLEISRAKDIDTIDTYKDIGKAELIERIIKFDKICKEVAN